MDVSIVLNQIANRFSPETNVATGKWFGKPCINVGKKAFAIQWGKDFVFKLTDPARAEALKLEGARLFDPRGTGSPMKEWVQIPQAQSAHWETYAGLACEFVSSLS